MGLDLLGLKRRSPAECVVRVGVDGAEITDLYPFLVEVVVENNRNEAATATLTFETRRDESGRWLVQDAGVLLPWEAIVIQAVFGTEVEEVMRGYIKQVTTEYPQDPGAAQVKVECQDDSLRLDRTQRRFPWGADGPTTDTTILSTILGTYDLTPHPENGAGDDELSGINQDETDIQFLKKRAEANGYELCFAEGYVYFGPPRLSAAAQDTILVQAGTGTNCLSLSIHADSHQADAVAVDIPDAEGDGSTETILYPDLYVMGTTHADSLASGLEDFTWRLSGAAGADEARLIAEAQRKANEFDLQKVKADGELDGTLYGHVLAVGKPVGVDGVGEWMGGTYYVDKVSHHFAQDGYRQRFTLLRNAFGDNLDSLGGASAIAGVTG